MHIDLHACNLVVNWYTCMCSTYLIIYMCVLPVLHNSTMQAYIKLHEFAHKLFSSVTLPSYTATE